MTEKFITLCPEQTARFMGVIPAEEILTLEFSKFPKPFTKKQVSFESNGSLPSREIAKKTLTSGQKKNKTRFTFANFILIQKIWNTVSIPPFNAQEMK